MIFIFLFLIVGCGAVNFTLTDLPVAGESIRVILRSEHFDDGSKFCAVTSSNDCTGLSSVSIPSSSVGVHQWVLNDKQEWFIILYPTETSSWSNSVVFFCSVENSNSPQWEVIDQNGRFVFPSHPSYTTEPLHPVAAIWSNPLRVSINGIDGIVTSQSMISLSHSKHHIDCELNPVGGASPRPFDDLHTKTVLFDSEAIGRDLLEKTSVSIYVCLSVGTNIPHMVIPMDKSQVEISSNGGPPQLSFDVYSDGMNTTNNETDFTIGFDCGYITEGITASCEITLLGSTSFSVSDFEIRSLTDGSGTLVCPFPSLVFYNGTLSFSFVPERAGELGRVQIFLRGLPLYLEPDLQLYTPSNDTSDYTVDHTVFRFVVLENERSATTFGSELVINGDAEFGNSSEPIVGWDATLLSSSSIPDAGFFLKNSAPAADYGLFYFSLAAGVESALTQLVTLPTSDSASLVRFRASIRFFQYLSQGAPPREFVDFQAVFDWLDGSMNIEFNSTVVVSHTEDRRARVLKRVDDDEDEELLRLPFRKWNRFFDEREIDLNTVKYLRITVIADTSSGGHVAFDEISLRVISHITTSLSERSALTQLFQNTNGDSWIDNKNWNIGDPCSNHWIGVHCSYSKVTSLKLPFNNLVGQVEGIDLSLLSNLKELDLSNNKLFGIFNTNITTKLNKVNINYNRFNVIEGVIPICLKSLSAVGNLIEEMPSIWGLPDLEYVDLSNNKITSMINITTPEVLSEQTDNSRSKLRYVNLASNSLIGDIPSFSSGCYKYLTNIDLSGNHLNGSLSDGIGRSLPSLKVMDLHDNNIRGTLPTSVVYIWRPDQLRIDVRNNEMTEIVPSWVTKASHADIRGNYFSCPLPEGFLAGMSTVEHFMKCDAT